MPNEMVIIVMSNDNENEILFSITSNIDTRSEYDAEFENCDDCGAYVEVETESSGRYCIGCSHERDVEMGIGTVPETRREIYAGVLNIDLDEPLGSGGPDKPLSEEAKRIGGYGEPTAIRQRRIESRKRAKILQRESAIRCAARRRAERKEYEN
jgi:hypothetical protein